MLNRLHGVIIPGPLTEQVKQDAYRYLFQIIKDKVDSGQYEKDRENAV